MAERVTRIVTANSESDDISELRIAFRDLEEIILRICPDGRRKSIALTELETSQMYAVKSAYEKHDG